MLAPTWVGAYCPSVQDPNDVVADGQSYCALAIDSPVGGSGCCSRVVGSSEPRNAGCSTSVRAVGLSIFGDSTGGIGIAVPVLSDLAAETVGVSALGVEKDATGRFNLVRVVGTCLAWVACLLWMMRLA